MVKTYFFDPIYSHSPLQTEHLNEEQRGKQTICINCQRIFEGALRTEISQTKMERVPFPTASKTAE